MEKARFKFLKLIPDITTFGLYTLMLFVIIIVNRDTQAAYSNREMKNMLVYGEQVNSTTLFQVHSRRGYIHIYVLIF